MPKTEKGTKKDKKGSGRGVKKPRRDKGAKWEAKIAKKREEKLAKNPNYVPQVQKKKRGDGKAKEKIYTFKVDCSKPVGEKIFTVASFAEYLKMHVKVKGKVNNLGSTTRIIEDDKSAKVGIASKTKLQKRTLKYLTKRYLKKHQLRDWLRVVNHPDPKHKNEYLLKYYSIYTGDEQEGEQ